MKFFIALLFAFSATASLHASILVEPLIGYNLNTKFGDGGGKGMGYGGKLGYQSEGGLQIGVDYLKSSISMKDDDIYDANVDLTETSFFLGYKTDFFKIYGGLIFGAEAETKLIDGQKLTFENGGGQKIGLGFTGLKYIHINLEYRTGKFDQIKLSGEDVGSDKYSAVMLSLSIPLTL
jgi:hypothetical protein